MFSSTAIPAISCKSPIAVRRATRWIGSNRRITPTCRASRSAGPVIKNRAWLFGQFETYRVRGLQSSLFQIPSDAQRAAAVPVVQALINLYPRTTGGATTFNYGLANNINMNTWLIRGDVALTDRSA
jgi:hypothetical protein